MAKCTDTERALLDSMTRAALIDGRIIAQATEARLAIAQRQAIDRNAVIEIRKRLQVQLASIKVFEGETLAAIEAVDAVLSDSR